MAKFRKRRLLVVEWEDAAHTSAWIDASDCKERDIPLATRTVGWKVPSRKDCIVLIQSQSEYDDVCGRETIPRKYIKSIRKLE
jgi:hypothetical protein